MPQVSDITVVLAKEHLGAGSDFNKSEALAELSSKTYKTAIVRLLIPKMAVFLTVSFSARLC